MPPDFNPMPALYETDFNDPETGEVPCQEGWSAPGRRCISVGAVNIGAMFDANHADDHRLFVDLIDDLIDTAARRPQTAELASQRMADPLWSIEQRPEHELDHRGGDLDPETGEIPLRRGSDIQSPVGHSVPR